MHEGSKGVVPDHLLKGLAAASATSQEAPEALLQAPEALVAELRAKVGAVQRGAEGGAEPKVLLRLVQLQ
eukprot:10990420-Lingulodinium_polyedra.AAC.1